MLDTLLTQIRKIDKKHQKALKKLGLFTLKDLFFHFPLRYDDFSTISKISNLKREQTATVRGIIQVIENKRTPRKRMIITQALIKDKTGSILAIWFNQPFIARFLRPKTEVLLAGKVGLGISGLQLENPAYEKVKKDQVHVGRIVPVYSVTENLTSKWLRFIIKPLLKYTNQIKDFLSAEIKQNQNLISLPWAIREIHFPTNSFRLKQAKKRLVFDELFLIQLNSLSKRLEWQKNKSYPVKFPKELIKSFVRSLPYKLTDDQKRSAWEIIKDLEKEKPASRLLEGDVGSGKTVVATMAMLEATKAGLQSCLMAPTEILAKQHFETISNLLKKFDSIVGLLTRTDSKIKEKSLSKEISRSQMLSKLEKGKIQVLIGTHALLQEKVKFKDLALVIVDEQHRFGVKQRARLRKINKSGLTPHLLSMTATPIPRTLALSIYGDLDLSIISEMPKGRQKIETQVVSLEDREKTYDFISDQIKKGHQVYVVCPLIEESDKLGVKSATEEYKKLSKKIFPHYKIGLLHGKLKKEEKEKVMSDFAQGKIDILVSTPVIEVGIDVPNVTVMMIEGAERFGLAQLYQFRGRVGRGKAKSYCFLFSDSETEKVRKRLSSLVQAKSGFELAEIDLKMRGPGEVFGLRQWGIPDLKMASLMDAITLKKARDEAKKLLEKEPQLKNFPQLREKLKEFGEMVHLE